LIVAVQGYGNSHPNFGLRNPTAAEQRYMIYVSIATENCVGVLVFMDSWADDEDKKIILPIMKEIHDIGFAAIAKGKSVACTNPAVRTRRCGKTLIAVNTTPDEQKGVSLDGRVLDFAPFQVHLIK
jgi:hypothetical protein